MNEAWSLMLEKLNSWVETLTSMMPNMILALFVILITVILSRISSRYISRLLNYRIDSPSVRNLLSTFISIFVIALGLFLALGILNLDKALTSILAGAGVAGLAIGLALQGTLSNTFAGIFLAFKDVMSVGDFIETDNYSGTVDQITLRYIKLREPDNNIVIIPNKIITENPFKNYGLTQQVRTSVTCGVSYDSDLEEVKNIAISAIQRNFPVSEDNEIEFYYTSFGDSSINFLLRFWVKAITSLSIMEAKSKAIELIKSDFDINHIDIPYPIRSIKMDSKIT